MPPVLDPSKSKVDGLAFLGLSLAQKSEQGHPESATHQTAFDLNQVLDRDYGFLFSTNDDGWLVGGGEPGPPVSYKLAAKDSAHVEIMRVGTYRKDWGGVPLEELLEGMKDILIPQIEVVPTAVVANPDRPPELEIRFDMEPERIMDWKAPLPINWQLRFIHNQLFKKFVFPSRFCPGAFHSTILRKAEFRSEEHRTKYFAKCDAAIAEWRKKGPQPLNTVPRTLTGEPMEESEAEQEQQNNLAIVSSSSKKDELPYPEDEAPAAEEKKDDDDVIAAVASPEPATPVANVDVARSADAGDSSSSGQSTEIQIGDTVTTPYGTGKVLSIVASSTTEETESFQIELPYGKLFVRLTEVLQKKPENDEAAKATNETTQVVSPKDCHSGIWLFTDRENITHFFKPNFLPPYDTPEKMQIILDVLKEEWDEETLSWKPCGQGSMSRAKAAHDASRNAAKKTSPQHINQLEQFMGNVLSTMNSYCTPQNPTEVAEK